MLTFDERPDLAPRQRRVGPGLAPRPPRWPSSPRPPTATSTSGWPTSSASSPQQHGIDVYKVIEASNSQPYSHIHLPGIAVGGHCIPVYPRLYLYTDPDATIVRTAREANMTMPEYAIGLAEGALGDLAGKKVVVLGASYRGRVEGDRLLRRLPDRRGAGGHGAPTVDVHDPMFTDDELARYGFDAYHLGDPVDVAIVQADHPEYRDAHPGRPARRPGAGRRPARHLGRAWTGVQRLVIGDGPHDAGPVFGEGPPPSTVHNIGDTRIVHKEVKSLQDAGFDVALIACHDGDTSVAGVPVLGIGEATSVGAATA